MGPRARTNPWTTAAVLAFVAATRPASAATLTLDIPAAPAQGYTVKGQGFAPGSWIWVDVNDLTDGSQPVHGPDAFQPDANGAFTRTGVTPLTCGHAFQATAFVDNQVAASSPSVTPACAPTPAITLLVPDAPATGFTVRGTGFTPDSWIWITVADATDGTKPVDGPDAFQPDANGAFTRTGATALPCGHALQATAWVNDLPAAVSGTVTPACQAAVPAITLTIPDAPATGFTVQGTGFAPGSWIWITVEDITEGTKPVDGPDAFQPGANGAFTRSGATALPCGHAYRATAWVDNRPKAVSGSVTPACQVARPAVTLAIPDAPGTGLTVRGTGFTPGAWIWIDVDDLTDGSQPVHGPEAFLPDAAGAFTRTSPLRFACGHTFRATAWVNDQAAAVSAAATPSCAAAAPALALTVPDAPATGFTVRGTGFAAGSWIWVTVEDVTNGTQPVDGPDAFQPAADGSFSRTGATALPCGHALRANAWVDNRIAAVSTLTTSGCAPAGPVLALSVPDAPGRGFTVSGRGFDPAAWVWLTVEDATNGTKPVDGPDAFQPGADGTFNRGGWTALPCGHAFTAKAWVLDKVAATSSSVTPRCAGDAAATADPDATAAARAVLSSLQSAPARPDHRVVIGQALRGWDFNQPVAEPVTSLTNAGLPAPKLLEVDITDFGVTPEHDQELYGLLLDHASRGGLVGLTFHADNPFTGGSVYDTGGVNLPELAHPATPATAAATRWQAELNHAADVIRHFEAAGAVVLFRPLHESNGSWFWWGQVDPAAFRSLWQGVFDYLTRTQGLHNLLWVYSANRNLGGELSDPTRLYPGGGVVDVVGLDIYDDDLADAGPGEPGYAAMVALGKPFGITEYGAGNWPAPHDGAVNLPNAKVIQLIKEKYPNTVLASAWYSSDGDNWQISDKPDPAALLLDPWAVTR